MLVENERIRSLELQTKDEIERRPLNNSKTTTKFKMKTLYIICKYIKILARWPTVNGQCNMLAYHQFDSIPINILTEFFRS